VDDYRATARLLLWYLANERDTPEPTLADLTAAAIRCFLAYSRDPNASGRYGNTRPASMRRASSLTQHKHCRNVRVFGNWLVRDELLPESPTARLRGPQLQLEQREPLSADEARLLLNGARSSGFPDRDAALVLLLLDTGMRASEVCALTVADGLCPEGRAIVCAKRRRRTVFWSPDTARALRRYLRSRSGALESDPLFVTRTGRAFGPGNVGEVVRDAGKRGQVGRPVFPHLLRHTAALAMLRGGASLFEVQRLLGHADLTVLRRYVRETVEDLASAHRRSSPVVSMLGSRRQERPGAR